MKTGKILATLGIVMLLGGIAGALLWPSPGGSVGGDKQADVPPPSLPALPSPNGYDMLLQAGDNTRSPNSPVAEMSRGALETYLLSHDDAFEIATAAFETECRVVLDGEVEFSPARQEGLEALQRLAELFTARALLAEGKVQMQVALDAHLERLRLGSMVAQGGITEDLLVGVLIEEGARSGIEAMIRKLTKLSLENALERLTALEDSREMPDAHREWGELIDKTIHPSFLNSMTVEQRAERREGFRLALQKNTEQLRKLRALILQVAGRLYEFQTGKTPDTLSALVPSLISEIPIDPTTGNPFEDTVMSRGKGDIGAE